jgi:hypothetical protein
LEFNRKRSLLFAGVYSTDIRRVGGRSAKCLICLVRPRVVKVNNELNELDCPTHQNSGIEFIGVFFTGVHPVPESGRVKPRIGADRNPWSSSSAILLRPHRSGRLSHTRASESGPHPYPAHAPRVRVIRGVGRRKRAVRVSNSSRRMRRLFQAAISVTRRVWLFVAAVEALGWAR